MFVWTRNRIEDIYNVQQKPKPPDINNTSFIMYKWNEKLIIQSTDFLVESAIPKSSLQSNTDLVFESFHHGIKCIITSLYKRRIHGFSGCRTYTKLCNTSIVSHIHEALRYLKWFAHTRSFAIPQLFRIYTKLCDTSIILKWHSKKKHFNSK